MPAQTFFNLLDGSAGAKDFDTNAWTYSGFINISHNQTLNIQGPRAANAANNAILRGLRPFGIYKTGMQRYNVAFILRNNFEHMAIPQAPNWPGAHPNPS